MVCQPLRVEGGAQFEMGNMQTSTDELAGDRWTFAESRGLCGSLWLIEYGNTGTVGTVNRGRPFVMYQVTGSFRPDSPDATVQLSSLRYWQSSHGAGSFEALPSAEPDVGTVCFESAERLSRGLTSVLCLSTWPRSLPGSTMSLTLRLSSFVSTEDCQLDFDA